MPAHANNPETIDQWAHPHHANEQLRCAEDGEAWPCDAYTLARRRADALGINTPTIRVES